jgi:GAF domain-containing protein
MTVRGKGLSYTCSLCAHEWAERRMANRRRADLAPPHAAAHQAVQAICGARELGPLMEATCYWARHLTRADGVTIVLREGDNCYFADEDAIEPLWKGRRFPLTSCVSGWVMLNRQPAMIPDIYGDPRVLQEVYRPTFVRSMLMVPVRKSDPIAAIGAYWKTVCAPTDEHVQLLELLAEAAAAGLSNQVAAGLGDQLQREAT